MISEQRETRTKSEISGYLTLLRRAAATPPRSGYPCLALPGSWAPQVTTIRPEASPCRVRRSERSERGRDPEGGEPTGHYLDKIDKKINDSVRIGLRQKLTFLTTEVDENDIMDLSKSLTVKGVGPYLLLIS